jgi:hypothetical protein
MGAAPNLYYRSQVGKRLAGVSVFAVDFLPHRQLWKFNTRELGESGIVGLDELLSRAIDGSMPIYLVTGLEQPDLGTDGEPLLRGVKILKQLTPRELYWEGYFDPEQDIER